MLITMNAKMKMLLFLALLLLPILSMAIAVDPEHIRIATSVCEDTFHKDLCVSTVSTLPELHKRTIPEIISGVVNSTVFEVGHSFQNCSRIKKKFRRNLDPHARHALDDCLELLENTRLHLREAISDLSSNETAVRHYNDVQTLFSAAMTNQYTCLDGFAFSKKKYLRKFIEGRIRDISRHVSNSLAMLKKIKPPKPVENPGAGEGYILPWGSDGETLKDGFPTWLKRRDRELLQAPLDQIDYDVTVAQDGSGDYTTINDALRAAPNSSKTRYVIYIKTGAYYEYVEVEKSKPLIMFIGDGIGKTQIKGNRNVIDGWSTFRSFTVAAVGQGFIARGISFENYAGPDKHQAVAVRVGADFAAFYQCSFIGYQDTLYVHSLRQFFRECDVYGTVDFIFGNSAVVFQQCNLYARKPNSNQQNLFTAQGRDDQNQNTGISILNSKIAAGSELIPYVNQFRNYLGRPWKQYSRTVILLTNIEGLIDPAGYLPWNGSFGLDTLYYGEYRNRGAGSVTSHRVNWPGYRVITDPAEAGQFTVGNFIDGDEWIPATGVPFYPNLTP